MKVAAKDKEIGRILYVNENIELETMIKVRAELLRRYKEGKTYDWDPELVSVKIFRQS